jgi:transposase
LRCRLTRGGAYAEGANQGAPDAVQIADRFHLLRNLMDALERACTRHHAALRTAAATTHPKPVPKEETRMRRYSGLPNNRPGPTRAEQRSAERRTRRLARYEQVVALRAGGMSKLGIARAVGLDRRTVDTWLAAGHFPERAPKARQPHRLDPHADFLTRRYDEGLTNAAHLARELRERGVQTSDQAVRRYLTDLRRLRPRGGGAQPAPPPRVPTRAPSPREAAWLLRNADRTPGELTDEERAFVAATCAQCPELARARAMVDEFARLLDRHDAAALFAWLTTAEQSGVRELRAFAAGVRRDRDAVLAAVLFAWSNGQTEGQVHRLKLLKRAMFTGGRASPSYANACSTPPERRNTRRRQPGRRSPASAQSQFEMSSDRATRCSACWLATPSCCARSRRNWPPLPSSMA